MSKSDPMPGSDFGSRRLSVELTNICNLHCSYCLRDEDALYHSTASFLSIDLLKKIAVEARKVMGITRLSLTGGEPTLHPQFAQVLELVESNGLVLGFVTNGWHFERIWPSILLHKAVVASVGFSLDGITRESHDHWRGNGSFERVVKAMARCYASDIPFAIKIVIRRDTVPILEQIALFAARLGATSLNFAHLLQTSDEIQNSAGLSFDERHQAEQEIANLSRIFKMRIGLDVGYYNIDLGPPCSPLAGVSANIDYRGRLTLCCNLSGFRGAVGEGDVVADLNVEDFSSAFPRLSRLAAHQRDLRRNRLLAEKGHTPDLAVGSPCMFCLETFGKTPWRQSQLFAEAVGRSLPVLS